MEDAVMRVSLGRVLPGCEDMDPPIQPMGAEDHKTLEGCHGWALTWPKTQIRLGGRSTGATSIVRPTQKATDVVATGTVPPRDAPPVVATGTIPSQKAPTVDATAPTKIMRPPRRKALVVDANTSRRHQQLLGVSAPPQGNDDVVAPQPPRPSSPPHHDTDMVAHDAYNSDDDQIDTDAFLNTGADMEGFYMPTVNEEFQARDANKAGGSKSTKQRLVFTGFSQEETPPAAETQDKPAGTVFSPNTIRMATGEQLASPAVEEPLVGKTAAKRPRKRSKTKAASQPAASQPAQLRFNDMLVPPRTDGLTRMHEAGRPILDPELQNIADGEMLSLQNSIQFLEELLLKDKDPNYPVISVKVPKDVDFVTDAPADVFFIAHEDIFKLFHGQRLNYNLVRLFALNLAMKIKRENAPLVAVADPYYMRDSQLVEGSMTRIKAKLYLQKFFLDNKRKDTVLLPFFPE